MASAFYFIEKQNKYILFLIPHQAHLHTRSKIGDRRWQLVFKIGDEIEVVSVILVILGRQPIVAVSQTPMVDTDDFCPPTIASSK